VNSSFFFFFSSLNRFWTLNLFPSSSQFSILWSRLSLLLLAVNSRWNCRGNSSMMKIHHCWISESLKFFFLTEFSYGFDLTDMREKNVSCLCWCGADSVDLWHCVPFIGCHVCLWANELVTCGLDWIWRGFGLELASFWPWGPICKYVKYLDCFAK